MLEVTWFEYPSEIVWWQLALYYLGVAWGAFIIGCFGVGGGAVFMPLMLMLPGVTPAVAAGTVFCGCLPMSYSRLIQLVYFGRLTIRKALPLMLGALVGALLGQVALPYLPRSAVSLFVAAIAIFAGVQAHRKVMQDRKAAQGSQQAAQAAQAVQEAQEAQAQMPPHVQLEVKPQILGRESSTPSVVSRKSSRRAILSVEGEPETPRLRCVKAVVDVCLGMIASFLSSISGTGGPLIVFPMWLLLDPQVSMRSLVAMSSPFANVLVTFSTLGALLFGKVDLGLASIFSGVAVVSVVTGGMLSEKLGDSRLKQAVGFLLMILGLAVGSRTVVGFFD